MSAAPNSDTTSAPGLKNLSGATQIEVEQALDRHGFVGQFGARKGGMVLCCECRSEFSAELVDADAASRIEGASDPSDMAVVVPTTCPSCGTSGTLTMQYGPLSSEEESEVLALISRKAPIPPLDPDGHTAVNAPNPPH